MMHHCIQQRKNGTFRLSSCEAPSMSDSFTQAVTLTKDEFDALTGSLSDLLYICQWLCGPNTATVDSEPDHPKIVKAWEILDKMDLATEKASAG